MSLSMHTYHYLFKRCSDDGNTFTKPEMCPIAEDAPFGCSAGLVSDQGRLFLSEPRGPQRVGLVIHCSLDGGVTWPLNYPVGGAKDPAAYSAMRVIDNHQTLLVVYEFGSNFLGRASSDGLVPKMRIPL